MDAHHSLARKIAAEGMVLAQERRHPAPARPSATAGHSRSPSSVAPRKAAHFQGGGSSHINPTRVDVPFQELQARAPADAELTYAEGYPAG